MSDGLTKLNSIGAQKIHEQTHIARQNVQAMLHESFDDMTRIQFLGFVSILERDYNVNLDDLRLSAERYFDEENPLEEDKKVFVIPEKKKRYTLVYLAIVAIIFVVAILVSIDNSSNLLEKEKNNHISNEAIDDAKENIKIADPDVSFVVVDENITSEVDANISSDEINVTVEEIIKPIEVVKKSFKIISENKLWLGYMDLKSRKKKQKIFTGEFDLDPKKDWLLSLGHGYVNIEIDTDVTEFKSKYNIKLLYKDASIKKISFDEYKEINRGSKW